MMQSSTNFLDKIMETMITQMFNNQSKDHTPACNNQTCISKPAKKSRKRRKHYRCCKKKPSRCPTDDVARIICVTKCIKKCKKTQKKTKCRNPCSSERKSRSVRLASCPSDCSDSEPKYCNKCGQPLPETTVLQKNSPEVRSYLQGIPSPEETCISCHTQTTCTRCQNRKPTQSHRDIVGQYVSDCNFFDPPYFLGHLNNPKPEDLRGGYSRNIIGLTDVEKQKKCLVELTCCENRSVNASSGNKRDCPPPDDGRSRYPAAVHIKRCGKNIVTVRCGEGGDFDLSCIKTDDNARQNNSKRRNGDEDFGNGKESQVENTECSRRFIQITENQRSDYGGNCITKVRCADYSSITSGAKPTSNRNCAEEVPVKSSCSGRDPENENIQYGPCSDRSSSGVHAAGRKRSQQVVRMKFVKPYHHVDTSPCDLNRSEIHRCSNTAKAGMDCNTDNHDSDCDAHQIRTCVSEPTCKCYCRNTSRPPVLPFCYDPATDNYEDEFCVSPCHCIDDPPAVCYPPNPPYRQPYEYRPVQRLPSESSDVSSDADKSIPPDNRYGYDFFYGTVKSSKPSDERNSTNKLS